LRIPDPGHAGEWSAVTLMDAYAPSTDAPAEASPTATQVLFKQNLLHHASQQRTNPQQDRHAAFKTDV